MTVYGVLLRIPQTTHRGSLDLNRVVNEAMAPFYENTKDEKYLTFRDTEDDDRKDYEDGSVTMVRGPDGVLRYTWDETYRVPETIGFGIGGDTYDHDKPGHVEEEVTFKAKYPTFDEYLSDWCGKSRDPKTGRVGYWRNPNGKWDWWQPAKWLPGEVGQAYWRDIKGNLAQDWARDLRKFFDEYQRLIEGHEFGTFDGPRRKALDLGLVRVERGPYTSVTGKEVVQPWAKFVRPDDQRHAWNDVLTVLTFEEFATRYRNHFHPMKYPVTLDGGEWREPGKMGWWGTNSADVDDYVKYAAWFVEEFIPSLRDDDALVTLRCHT